MKEIGLLNYDDALNYDHALIGDLRPRPIPPAKEVRLFLQVAQRLSKRYPCTNAFGRWLNGDLQREWNSERERVGVPKTTGVSFSARKFRYVSSHEAGVKEIENAGIAVIERWATQAKLVSNDGTPLWWLVLWINLEFQGEPKAPTRIGTWPPPRAVGRLVMLRAAGRGLPRKSPTRRGGTYSEIGPEALILALMGMGWTKSCETRRWNDPTGARKDAESFAKRLGIRWPLGLTRGRPIMARHAARRKMRKNSPDKIA